MNSARSQVYIVDPISGGVAVLAAKYGVKKVARALLGEGEEAELVGELIGLFETVEQSHARLIEIERRLDVLIAQRYQIASGLGLRYLQQAMLRNRPGERRDDDLARAEDSLLEAVEAATSALQRALCERLLLIVRLARNDEAGASDSQIRFDLELGETVCQLWTLLGAHHGAVKNVELGEVGLRQFIRRGLERWNIEKIRESVRKVNSDADVEVATVAELFTDARMFAGLLGTPSPTHVPQRITGLLGWDGEHSLTVGAVPGTPVRIGGITCTIERATPSMLSAQVHLSSRRRTAVSARLVTSHTHVEGFSAIERRVPDEEATPGLYSAASQVRPGATAQLSWDPTLGNDFGSASGMFGLSVSGMSFYASHTDPAGGPAAPW